MRKPALAASMAVAALALAACGSGGDSGSGDSPSVDSSASFAAGTTMAKLNKAGSVKVGTKFDQPLFGLKGLSGKPEGFDVEVAKIIAGALGIAPDKIQWVETTSKVRESKIVNGDVDMVVATYTINDKRKKQVSFAGPYYTAGQQMMVRKDDSKITGPESLKSNPSSKVCSVTGSTPAENIKKYLASPSQLVLFDSYSKCADALKNNQVAAETTDNVILLGLANDSKDAFKLVGETFTKEPYGIGIKKGDTAFCQFVNDTLKANADAYKKAWEDTAGKVEGSETPELPSFDKCS